MDGLRPARASDTAAIADLAARAYAIYLERLGGAPEPVGADYAKLIREAIVFVLPGDGDGLAASLTMMAEADHLLIWSLAVDPTLQGQGVGCRLMAFSEDEARRRGFNEIRLHTNERMAENVGFYAALGYAETHRGPSARIAGTELVHMGKRLGGG